MTKLTKAEVEALQQLNRKVLSTFRSKTTLKVLCSLQEKGMISYDPFACKAELTDLGRARIS